MWNIWNTTHMSTICQVCGNKAKWVVGNKRFNLWACEYCDEIIEKTGICAILPLWPIPRFARAIRRWIYRPMRRRNVRIAVSRWHQKNSKWPIAIWWFLSSFERSTQRKCCCMLESSGMTTPSKPLIFLFTSLVLLDMVLIGAILVHGKVNFVEVFNYLK